MWPSHPGAGWQGQLIERPSSAVGKPGVKPDAPSALERGRQKQRFPLESADKDQPDARQIKILTQMSRI
jgi:hypothetical protein